MSGPRRTATEIEAVRAERKARRVAASTVAPEAMATTRIRRRSIPNVETDRLTARRDHLVPLCTTNAGTRTFEGRSDWIARVAELVCIEHELVRRGVLAPEDRRTTGNPVPAT